MPSFLDPANHAACAPFRIQWQKTHGAAPCPRQSGCHSTIAQLQRTALELCGQLNFLQNTVLQQVVTLCDDLALRDTTMHDITCHMLQTASMFAQLFPQANHSPSIQPQQFRPYILTYHHPRISTAPLIIMHPRQVSVFAHPSSFNMIILTFRRVVFIFLAFPFLTLQTFPFNLVLCHRW